MNKKILKTITILMLITTLTMANFVLICADAVSIAADAINADEATNNKNVDFAAYFKNENGEQVDSIDAKMNAEDLKLYFKISVKQEGLFNGNIVLSDANFKFKPEFTDTSISKIEDNKIYLNQINAGETKEIEVGIQLLVDSNFDLSLINRQSKLNIEGIYRNSKEKDIKVSATRAVTANMVSPYESAESCINLSQNIITNKIVKYNGEEKRIIQVQINSGITNNLTPIKSSVIKVQAPKISDKYPETLVSSNQVLTTNGKNISQDNWNYDKETGITTIDIENTPSEDNKIVWTKNGNDNVIVTYIYDKDVEIKDEKISTSSEISLYENKNTVVNASAETPITKDETDSIITTNMQQSENSIYKGKIYAGLERDITYSTVISSNLVGTTNEINLIESEQQINNKNIDSTYKTTTINKDNVLSVLGNDGELTILNAANNTEIAKINNDSVADENGNIVITYAEGVQTIAIKASAPKNTGNINITTTKAIGKISEKVAKDAKEILTKLTATTLENTDTVTLPEIDSKIELQETETKAELQLNKTEFSTMSTNNVEMRVILYSRDENNDLYKNPTIRIQLPSTVEKVTLNSVQLIDEEELKVASYNMLDGNVLEIKLSGEQTNYKDLAIEGATLILNMDIDIDKKSPSTQEQIKLTCVNGEKTVQSVANVNFVSYAGVVTINRVQNYGIETVNDQGNGEATLPINSKTATTSKVENEIINNEDNDITDVKLMGTFPTKDATNKNNMEVAVSGVTVAGADENGTQVYYTENANATDDTNNAENGWTENITDSKNVKKYLVKMNKMAAKQNVNTSYDMQVPASLDYNQSATENYNVNYNSMTTAKQTVATAATIETEKGATLEVSLKALVGDKEATTVNEGEIIRYEAIVKNTGSEDIENAKIIAKVPAGTTLINSDKLNYTEAGQEDSDDSDDNIELDQKEIDRDIGKILKGEEKTVYYEVRPNKQTEGQVIKNSVQLQYGEVTKESNEVSTTITKGTLSLILKNTEDTSEFESGYSYRYILYIQNLTDQKLENVNITINNPEGTSIKELFSISKDIEVYDTNTTTIKEIDPSEEMHMAVYMNANVKDTETGTVSATAKVNNAEANSNKLDLKIENSAKSLEMSVTSTNSGEYVKAGDKIVYNISLKNNGTKEINDIQINNTASKLVTIDKVTRNDKELSEEEYQPDISSEDDNSITLSESKIDAGETINYTIEVEPNSTFRDEDVIEIINKTELKYRYISLKTIETKHLLKTEKYASDDNTEDDNKNNSRNTFIISGTAWVDSNENGQIDDDEQKLEGIKVKLLNPKTNEYIKDNNGNTLEQTTNSDGLYAFSKIDKGEYLVIFEYDKDNYNVTEFEKNGVSNEKNSKAIEKTLTIDGKETKVATTEKINLAKDVSNFNIGLVPVKKFDMQLDKYVTKVTVQNSQTVTKNYENEKLAKQEIKGKEVNSTTVVVEYTIRITNKGDVPGYVKKVADYLSSDYKFNSELNKDWYQENGVVYSTSLADTKINPGESKDLKLIAIKQMKESNVGLTTNTAEIVNTYNELGLKDINSTEGNKVQGENDMSSADVIIAIKTGQIILTITLIITAVLIAIAIILIIRKRELKKENF